MLSQSCMADAVRFRVWGLGFRGLRIQGVSGLGLRV